MNWMQKKKNRSLKFMQNDQLQKPAFYNIRGSIIVLLISLAYLALSWQLIGYKSDQLFLVILFSLCFFSSRISRKFILGFSIFIVYWIIFDFMKAFPNYSFNDVNIGSLYDAEKRLFGSEVNGVLMTPNEVCLYYANTFLDVLCGIFYLCWVPVPLAFAAYLFLRIRTFSYNFHSLSCSLICSDLSFTTYTPQHPPGISNIMVPTSYRIHPGILRAY